MVTSVLKSLANLILPRLRKAITFVADKLKAFGDLLSKIDIKKSRLYKGLVELPKKISALAENKTLKTVFSTIKKFGSEAVEFLSDKFASLKTNIEAIKMPNGLKDLFDNIKNFIKSIFGKNSIDDTLSETLGETAAATDGITGEGSEGKLTAFQKFLQGVSDAFNWLKTAAGKAKDAIADFIDFIVTNTPKALKSFHDFLAGEDGLLTLTDLTDAAYVVSTSFSDLLVAFGFEKMGKALENISDAFGDLTNSIVNLAKRTSNKMQMSALKDFAIGVGILVGALWVLSKIPAKNLAVATTALLILGFALTKFFDQISNLNAKLNETAGLIPISILLVAISGSMLAVAASL